MGNGEEQFFQGWSDDSDPDALLCSPLLRVDPVGFRHCKDLHSCDGLWFSVAVHVESRMTQASRVMGR